MDDIGGRRWRLEDRRYVAGELLGVTHVLLPDTGRRFDLNRTASVLWAALEQGATVAELGTLLVDRYGIPAEQARAEATALLGDLIGQDLVSPIDEVGPPAEDPG